MKTKGTVRYMSDNFSLCAFADEATPAVDGQIRALTENGIGLIELRGVGIIDVKQIFGIGAVKDAEKIDMIINLEAWVDGKMYDRLGLVDEYTEILGIEVPSILIPVKPGRNLAIIVEIAAMNNRAKRMGYNAAEVLNNRLLEEMKKNMGDEIGV